VSLALDESIVESEDGDLRPFTVVSRRLREKESLRSSLVI
jgi:hypothetical protein